jgi:hypothetical protein
MKKSIIDVAKVIRSKNAGPYELTLDIMFKDEKYFNYFRDKEIITRKTIAQLYKIPEDDITNIIYFKPSFALKVTMRRWQPSGAPGETDIYGAQQHAPLLGIEFEYRE